MTHPSPWLPVETIGELFARYWDWASSWLPSERLSASLRDEKFDSHVRSCLAKQGEDNVLQSLNRFVPRHDDECARPQILAVLRLIDEAFLRIHPRSMVVSGSIRAERIPKWLRNYREIRMEKGAYFQDEKKALIPRGPLLRAPRGLAAASADTLADRFAALTVQDLVLMESGRTIRVACTPISLSTLVGIGPTRRPGHERIASAPVMEDESDLELTLTMEGEIEYLRYSMSSAIDASARILAATISSGLSDIFIAPEFTVDSVAATELARLLGSSATSNHKLIAAGTGDAVHPNGRHPYNEMRLMNGLGVELWRQRKLWPACIDGATARVLGLEPRTDAIYEASSAGNELVVADSDSLGRILVLICQDLKLSSAANLIERIQPDWVLVPIMDRGTESARWTHQRAFEISEVCQTRFIICSCLSLAAKMGRAAPTPCLSAVGPKRPVDCADIQRAFRSETVCGTAGENYAALTWRDGSWLNTVVDAVEPSPK